MIESLAVVAGSVVGPERCSWWRSRTVNLTAGLSYMLALLYAYNTYLNPVFSGYGFTYSPLSLGETELLVAFSASVALLVPRTIVGPGRMIVWLLYTVVFLPTLVVTICLEGSVFDRYLWPLTALFGGFVAICLSLPPAAERTEHAVAVPDGLTAPLMVLWLGLLAIQLAYFGSTMKFVGLDQVYEQRELGATRDTLSAYSQTYLAAVVSPALFAYGLVRRRWVPLLAGFAGQFAIYLIGAHRTMLLTPCVMLIFYFAMRVPCTWRSASALHTSLLSVVVAAIAGLSAHVQWVSDLAVYLICRVLGIPGLAFSQYYDLFSQNGFTWWSNVKGISLVVSPPPAFASFESWPQLGPIIGELVYGNARNNVNANMFAVDGAAAAGALGVLLISLLFALWLRWLSKSMEGWNPVFTTLLVAPLGITLTNGQFFTLLLSYGGIFWPLVFWLFARGERRSIMPSAAVKYVQAGAS